MPKQLRNNRSATEPARSVELRRALQEVVTPEHIAAIGRVLLYKSLRGDLAAIKELFDRIWGRPQPLLENSDGSEPAVIQINLNRLSEEDIARMKAQRAIESKPETPE